MLLVNFSGCFCLLMLFDREKRLEVKKTFLEYIGEQEEHWDNERSVT